MKSNSLKGLLEVVLVTENSFTLLAQGRGQLNLVVKKISVNFDVSVGIRIVNI